VGVEAGAEGVGAEGAVRTGAELGAGAPCAAGTAGSVSGPFWPHAASPNNVSATTATRRDAKAALRALEAMTPAGRRALATLVF
jgi:hypothetical protein